MGCLERSRVPRDFGTRKNLEKDFNIFIQGGKTGYFVFVKFWEPVRGLK